MRTTGGNVRHHASRDLWEARYVGADGRRHSVYRKTKGAAQEALRAALSARDHGIPPVGLKLKTADYLEEWIETSVRQRCRPRTADSYADTVRRYLIPAIGRVPLAKLQPEQIRRMLADLRARGTLSVTTVRYVRSVLRTALGQALREGKVVRNVATLVDPPAKTQRELRPLTREQVRTFLAGVAGDRLEALYVTALGTGLRQGELLALRWQDVDLERGELTVRHTLQRFTRAGADEDGAIQAYAATPPAGQGSPGRASCAPAGCATVGPRLHLAGRRAAPERQRDARPPDPPAPPRTPPSAFPRSPACFRNAGTGGW